MTKKQKTEAVELEAVATVSGSTGSFDSPASGTTVYNPEDDVPFLNGQKTEARRPYLSNPNHEPIVEIAGKRFDMKDVDVKDIPVGLGGYIPWASPSTSEVNILQPRYNYKTNNFGRWMAHNAPLLRKDLKFKHLQVDGTDIYISTGSSLIVAEGIDSYGYISGAMEGPDNKSVLVIIASSITAKSISFMENNVLFNSVIDGGQVTLVSSTLERSSITGETSYIALDNSHVTDGYFFSKVQTTLTDTRVNDIQISGMKSILLDHVNGGTGFRFSTFGEASVQLDINIRDQYLNKYESDANYIPALKDYNLLSDFPIRHGSNDLNIDRRIDYGTFSAIQPVSFIRLNQFDLLVGNVVFSVKDFFPEYITIDPAPKLPESTGPFGLSFTSSLGGMYNRNSELWKRAAGIAFVGNKAVIGKTGETIVNNLLDQIKSRISLYVEISSLV